MPIRPPLIQLCPEKEDINTQTKRLEYQLDQIAYYWKGLLKELAFVLEDFGGASSLTTVGVTIDSFNFYIYLPSKEFYVTLMSLLYQIPVFADHAYGSIHRTDPKTKKAMMLAEISPSTSEGTLAALVAQGIPSRRYFQHEPRSLRLRLSFYPPDWVCALFTSSLAAPKKVKEDQWYFPGIYFEQAVKAMRVDTQGLAKKTAQPHPLQRKSLKELDMNYDFWTFVDDDE